MKRVASVGLSKRRGWGNTTQEIRSKSSKIEIVGVIDPETGVNLMNQRRNSITSILSDPDLKKIEKQIENIPYMNRTSKKSP